MVSLDSASAGQACNLMDFLPFYLLLVKDNLVVMNEE